MLLNLHVGAQDAPSISFEEETFDFGTIKEEAGTVEHKFIFTNTGAVPLVIQGVRASCGCTTPSWTREPIPPGQKGHVAARYNPTNRPGPFRKSLTITSNAAEPNKIIFIKGVVEGKPKSVEDEYRHAIGALRFKTRSFSMGRVTTEKTVTRSFEVYNAGSVPVRFSDQTEAPGHIEVSVQPEVLQPAAIGKIILSYDPVARKELGYVYDRIVVQTDEPQNNKKDIRVVASIEEYFPPMTKAQLEQAPKLSFEKNTHDFGDIDENEQVTTEFVLKNTGKSDLNIRDVQANCGCTVSQLDKRTLRPGETGTLQVTFNASGRRGLQHKSITVFSNDPSAPTQRLIIKAKVDTST